MLKNARRVLSVAAVALLMTACIGRVRAPTVELAGIRFGGIGLRGATLIAELNIDNPNDFTIETDSITFEFEAANPGEPNEWTRVTQGTNTQRYRLEEDQRTEVELPIDFTFAGLSAPVRAILDRGTFNYRVRGQVFVREPLKRTVPFSQTGNLSLVGAR